ncbi:MAG: HAD family hydrolase [Clostridiaceae bacterium]
MKTGNIKAILFDSGRTLNIPRTGYWFITPEFFNIVHKDKLPENQEILENAMAEAVSFIDKIKYVKTEKEEYLMFKEFYKIFLIKAGYPEISDNIIDALAKDNVYNDDKFLFFDDVEPSLKLLNEKYKLGVVSDTWPSLERVFINKGLMKYFSVFIMSSIYGSCKSEKLLFKIALEKLNIKPSQAVFIDDSESNLIAAEKFGLIPILIDRYETEDLVSRFPIIKSLAELSKVLNL